MMLKRGGVVNEDEMAGGDSSVAGLYVFFCPYKMTNISAAIMAGLYLPLLSSLFYR